MIDASSASRRLARCAVARGKTPKNKPHRDRRGADYDQCGSDGDSNALYRWESGRTFSTVTCGLTPVAVDGPASLHNDVGTPGGYNRCLSHAKSP